MDIGFALGGLGETVEAETPGEEAEARSEQADRSKRDPEPAENERKEPQVEEAGQLGIPRIIGVVEHVDAIADLRWRRRAGGGDELDGSTVRGCEADNRIRGNSALGIGFAGQVDDGAGGALAPATNRSVWTNEAAQATSSPTPKARHTRGAQRLRPSERAQRSRRSDLTERPSMRLCYRRCDQN